MNAAAAPSRRTGVLAEDPALSVDAFRRIAGIVRREAGIHLPDTKLSLVFSRLVRRVAETGAGSFERYGDLVSSPAGAEELRRMVEALTTNYTFFFREPHHFRHFETEVLPELAQRARAGGRVRIWSAGCSTGQETYSAAMSLLRTVPDASALDIRILATDIDRNVLRAASHGRYDETAFADVAACDRARFFQPAPEGHLEARPELRALIRFRELNLLAPWPMRGLFDVVFFRNVAIYFDQGVREAVWLRMADQIHPDGWLYAGHSERVTGAAAERLAHLATTTYRRLA
jgi:chemotaxis protein methyltransferase CheR